MKPSTSPTSVELFPATARDSGCLRHTKVRTHEPAQSPQFVSPWQSQHPSAEKEPDDDSRCVNMEPSSRDPDHLTTTDYIEGIWKSSDDFSSPLHQSVATDTNRLASSLHTFESNNSIAIS